VHWRLRAMLPQTPQTACWRRRGALTGRARPRWRRCGE